MILFPSAMSCRPGQALLIRVSIALMLLTGLGCSRASSSSEQTHAANEHEGDHGHDHDHEGEAHHHDHDHHHVPDHKPENFLALVTSLESRLQATELSDHDWEEVIDIVRWIPELAADSDLRRKDFESAMHVSEILLAELNQPALQKPVRISQKVLDGVATLKDLATRSDLRPNVESGTSEPQE